MVREAMCCRLNQKLDICKFAASFYGDLFTSEYVEWQDVS